MAATATANACSLFRSREPHTRGEHQLGRKRMGKAFPLAGAKVAGAPPSAGRPRNAP